MSMLVRPLLGKMAITKGSSLERKAKESRKRQAKVLALLLEESKALLAVTPKGKPFVSTSTSHNVNKQLEPVASVGAMSALKQIALNFKPHAFSVAHADEMPRAAN